jgi:hypothetical protein
MRPRRARLHRLQRIAGPALLVAAALIVGGCGTPAVVRAPSAPLSGLQHDINAAHNAVATTEQQERSAASAAP